MSDVPTGYKQTEVGVIPEDWGIYTIQELIDQNAITGHLDGNHGELYPRTHEFRDFGVPYITANDLHGSRASFGGCKFLSEQRASRFRKGIAKNGDVLFAHNATVGRTALLSMKLDYVILSTTVTYFRCNADKVVNTFLLYMLQSPWFVRQYQAVMAQSTRNQVPITAQRKLSVPLPPTLAEQEAIAEALSDADALIESLERLIAKKRLVKQAAMQELLTGKTRLPGFTVKPGYKQTEVGTIPEDWKLDTIEHLASITTGGKNTQDHVEDGQYPFFVRSQTVERIDTYSYDGEAVLTAGDGVGTGKVFHYIEGKFDVHQRVYRISDFRHCIDGYFFFLYFSTHFYNRIMQMTAKSSVDSVRREMIAQMQVPLPPHTEQTAIATVLSDMDAEIAILEQKLAKARLVKQRMMQELLTGRIRLV